MFIYIFEMNDTPWFFMQLTNFVIDSIIDSSLEISIISSASSGAS